MVVDLGSKKQSLRKLAFQAWKVCSNLLSSDWLVLGKVWICCVWATAGNEILLVSWSVLSLYSAYTEPYKVCPVSVIPVEVITSDEEQKSSEDEKSSQDDPSLINKVKELHYSSLLLKHVAETRNCSTKIDSGGNINSKKGLLRMLGQISHSAEGSDCSYME